MYKLFLCLRYLLHRRIAIVPILAVMLCVAMDLIVTSVMGGFLDKIRDSARGLFGDVIVSKGSLSGFGYYDAYRDADGNEHPGLVQYIRALSDNPPTTMPDGMAELRERFGPVIAEATPVIESGALLRLSSPDRRSFTAMVRVQGIVPDQYARVTAFQDGLYWQKPGPAGPVSVESERPDERELLIRHHDLRQRMDWLGPPSFEQTPLPGGRTVSLADRTGLPSPVGIIVGVRVFWPTPDRQGRYPRQMLLPGSESVQLTFLPMYASGVAAQQPVMRQFHLVDTSYSQIQQIDQATAYVPFDELQQYLDMGASDEVIDGFRAPARTSRVLVKVAPGVSAAVGREAVRAAVDRWLADREALFLRIPDDQKGTALYYESFNAAGRPDITVEVWEEANKEYFSAIENQKFITLLMVGVISLTVVALIWVIFIMIVVEKTKDIGIIKSVGGSAGGVGLIFVFWAAVLGLIGAAFGGVLGHQFVVHINGIEQWLSGALSRFSDQPVKLFDPRAYLFDSIPARFKWVEMLWISGLAVAAAMLGALLPAIRAGRMNPVDALRYE